MAETSLVNVIAVHATSGTAHPAIPAKGTNISQANWASAGFITMGKVDDIGNIIDLGDTTFEVPLVEKEYEIIRAPRGDAPEDHIQLSKRAEPFEGDCYSMQEDLWALDSNADITSNVFKHTSTLTKRTVAVEFGGGLGLVYYPQCVFDVLGGEGGFGAGGVILGKFRVMPEKTSALPSGFDLEWYQ